MVQPISSATWQEGPPASPPEFLARIAKTPAQLDAELILGFRHTVDRGPAYTHYALCMTTTGRKFVLFQQAVSPTPNCGHTVIMVKSADCKGTPLGDVLDDILTELHLRTTDLASVDPKVTFTRHALWRQDDNGNRYQVGTYPSRADATFAQRELESHQRRQLYWLVREA